MPVPRFLARQLARPSGLFGRVVMGGLLNRKTSAHNAVVLEELGVETSDRVLEVGFGGAALLEKVLRQAPEGLVAGVDLSEEMVTRARAHLRKPLAGGRLDLRVASVDSLPYPDAHFHKACSVNTIYFWPHLAPAFEEFRRVLRPGGLLVLGFTSHHDVKRARLDRHGFSLYGHEEIISALSRHGFTPGQLRSGADARGTFFVLPAQRGG